MILILEFQSKAAWLESLQAAIQYEFGLVC